MMPVPKSWYSAITMAAKPMTAPRLVREPPTPAFGRRPCAASGQGLLRGPPERAPPFAFTLCAVRQHATNNKAHRREDHASHEEWESLANTGLRDRLTEHAGARLGRRRRRRAPRRRSRRAR